jgi:hypothetical protein
LDKNATEKEVIDYLIHFTYVNKRDINKLSKPEIYTFSKTDEIISFIRKKKLIIVNSSSIISSTYLSNKLINFYLGKNTIKFNFYDGKPFVLEMKDNILSLKADDNEENQHLIQLITFYI